MTGLAAQDIRPRPRATREKPRAPGLDGVRALAVLAVMAFHEGMRAAPGGFLGVDVFFVLSGYLITDLLATRKDRLGRLYLWDFWIRRARRLLPALAVLLVTVTAAAAVIEPAQRAALRPVLLAAITYSSNWYQAFHHVSYFASFGPPPPLQHLWSLAIEEQFYLAWPLVIAVVMTRVRQPRGRALVAWLGAATSALTMAVLYRGGGDPSRVYFGTDTHATALLVGAALALTLPLAKLRSIPGPLAARFDFAGIAGLAVLAWAIGHFSGGDAAVYPLGLAVAAIAAAGLTAAAAANGSVSALLSLRPLRWLGARSYGIYLWHWPVIALATAVTGPGQQPPWRWIGESALAIVLAAASWKWIETPILRDGFLATCRSACRLVTASVTAVRGPPARALPAVLAAGAVSVACTALYGVSHPPAADGLSQQVAMGERVSAASQAHARHPAAPARHAAPPRLGAVPASGLAGQRPAGPAPGTAPAGRTPAAAQIRGRDVTAIGDSVMLASAPQLARALPGVYIDAQVSRQATAAVRVAQGLAASGELRRVVVFGLGTNGTVTRAELRELLRILGPRRRLVLVNTFEARPWEHQVNSMLAATARQNPRVVLADWHDAIDHRTALLWPDGVHPRPPGAWLYARILATAIRSARPLTAAAPRRLPLVAGSILRSRRP